MRSLEHRLPEQPRRINVEPAFTRHRDNTIAGLGHRRRQFSRETRRDGVRRESHLLGVTAGRSAEIEWPLGKCVSDHVEHEKVGSLQPGKVSVLPWLDAYDNVGAFVAKVLRRSQGDGSRHCVRFFHRYLERWSSRLFPDSAAIDRGATQRVVLVDRAAQYLS